LLPPANDWKLESGQKPPPVLTESHENIPRPPVPISGLEISTESKRNEPIRTKKLVFTKSFLNPDQSKLYKHKFLLNMGQLPNTPSADVTYSMLHGVYLNKSLMKFCPPRPDPSEKFKRNAIVSKKTSLEQSAEVSFPLPGVKDVEFDDYSSSDEEEKQTNIPGPPAQLPGPPAQLPGPPAKTNSWIRRNVGPPPKTNSWKRRNIGPPPSEYSNIPGAPPPQLSVPPPKTNSWKRRNIGPPPSEYSNIPGAPPPQLSVPPPKTNSWKRRNIGPPPPSASSIQLPPPPSQNRNEKQKRLSEKTLDDGGTTPIVPPVPAFIPSMSEAPTIGQTRKRSTMRRGKRSTGLDGLIGMKKKGSLHVMHKTTSHTTMEVHNSHVPAHLRIR
jgi:hypothetical protein